MKPIKKVIVNGFEINHKTKWNEVYKNDKWTPLCKAYDLYNGGAYPQYFRNELERCEGKQNIEIFTSNHNTFNQEKITNPEWFK